LYNVCKNFWKFNVQIIFYYLFSITRQKHKLPPTKQYDHSSINFKKVYKMSSVRLHTLWQLSSPLSHCNTDNFMVKSSPLHDSCDEVVDVTDSREVDHYI